MGNDKSITVSIPATLYEKVKGRIEGTEFTSVSDYIVFILREVVLEEDEEKETFTEEEEKKIKERLRSLGYLD